MTRMHSEVSVLDTAAAARIFEASLDILKTVGMRIDDDRFLKALEARGARVDYTARAVRFPETLLRETVDHIIRDNRAARQARPAPAAPAKPAPRRYNWGGGPAIFFHDYAKKEIRRGTIQDALTLIRLADAWEDIDGMCSTMLIYGTDEAGRPFDPKYYTLQALVLTAKHTAKVSYAENLYHPQELEYIEEISRILKPDVPPNKAGFASAGKCVISPLKLEKDACDMLYYFITRGYSCGIATMPISGATGPVTLAGTIALAHAEILGGWTALKAVNPEVRCGWCYYGQAINLQTGDMTSGGPEVLLGHLGINELFEKIYDDARHGIGSLYGDGKLPFRQAAVERALYYMGGSMAHYGSRTHFGITAQGQIISPEGALADLETAKWMDRFFDGFEVNADTLALDAIREAGIGGNYFATQHTVDNMRAEHWHSNLFDRRPEQMVYEDLKKRDLLVAAHERCRDLLARPPSFALAADKAKALDQVLEKAMADKTW